MKLTAIMGVGTYYVHWTPYVIASVYFCDEIVIVNGGLDMKNPDICEYNIPLERVSRDINALDVCGKILEVIDFSLDDLRHRHTLMTQYEANQKKPQYWYDPRGLNATLAAEIAYERGADLILYVQSDQPVYQNAMTLKERPPQSLMFYQREFAGDIYHLADPSPISPYDDAAFTFYPSSDNWFYGGCAPVIKGERLLSGLKCAHLRHANPAGTTEKERFEHFYGRLWFRYWTNEGLEGKALEERAKRDAETLLKDVWNNCRPANVQAPEVCYLGPGHYIAEVIAKCCK